MPFSESKFGRTTDKPKVSITSTVALLPCTDEAKLLGGMRSTDMLILKRSLLPAADDEEAPSIKIRRAIQKQPEIIHMAIIL